MRFDESLREVPVDVNELSVAIRQAQSLLQHVESDDQNVRSAIELLGYLGNACRVTGRSDESIQYLERAVSLCRKVGDAKGTVVNTIRLAEATKYHGDYETIAEMVMLPEPLTYLEDDRLAFPVYRIIHAKQVSQEFLQSWMSRFEIDDIHSNQAALRHVNAQHFLRSLYFLLQGDDAQQGSDCLVREDGLRNRGNGKGDVVCRWPVRR